MKVLAIGPAILLAAAVEAAVATPDPDGWSVAEVLLVIGAVTTAVTTIITALRTGQTKKAVEAVAAVNAVQTGKLTEIKRLVDGGKSELLGELAEIKRAVADKSNLPADRVAADSAQRKFDDQQARVEEAASEAEAARNRRAGDALEAEKKT